MKTTSIVVLLTVTLHCSANASTVYVKHDANGSNNGTTWIDAFTDIATAITQAESGDDVWVAAGTYQNTIRLRNHIRIIGGFTGTETMLSESDPVNHRTVIDGGVNRRCVESIGNDATAVLRGFVFSGGVQILEHNRESFGSAMRLENSSAQIVDCEFSENRTESGGGAVVNWGGAPNFINCRFQDNNGGMVAGAFINQYGSPVFVNCLFASNEAEDCGAVLNVTGTPTFLNCTFVENASIKGEAGALFDNPGTAILRNCVVWGNTSAQGSHAALANSPTIGVRSVVTHSVVQGGWSGDGNINADPLFVNAAGADYRLQETSPCVGLGIDLVMPPDLADLDWNGNTTEAIPVDLANRPRIQNAGTIDAGAYGRVLP